MENTLYNLVMRELLYKKTFEIEKKINLLFPKMSDTQIDFLENLKNYYFIAGFEVGGGVQKIKDFPL